VQPQKVPYTVAGQVTNNSVEEHCYNRPLWCCRTDHCKIRGHRLVQDHGRLHSALGGPYPYPSEVVGHRHVHLDLGPGPGPVLALGMDQGVVSHPSLDRAHVPRG
jgi:hypothetical protein